MERFVRPASLKARTRTSRFEDHVIRPQVEGLSVSLDRLNLQRVEVLCLLMDDWKALIDQAMQIETTDTIGAHGLYEHAVCAAFAQF